MTCPDCGYIMAAFDKECSRCATSALSGRNPYVAYQNQRKVTDGTPPASEVVPPVDARTTETAIEGTGPDEKANTPHFGTKGAAFTPRGANQPVSKRPRIFWKALLAAVLVVILYHFSVIYALQDKVDALSRTVSDQQKQIGDQQKQIDDLRDTVNYNANAANAGRF